MKTIFIICNSPEALQIIASGLYQDIHTADLFTCNNAYTFFRTSGRHLNFFTDTIDIVRHVKMPETLSKGYEKKVEFIYSRKGVTMQSGQCLFPDLKFSPLYQIGSSALNALAYLVATERYNGIHLIGYTLDETENPLWHDINQCYTMHRRQPNHFFFTLKK